MGCQKLTTLHHAAAKVANAPLHMLRAGVAQAGGFASNHSDIASLYAPVLFGLTNACASAFGSLGVLLVGTILDATGRWSLVLLMVACVNGLSAVVYLAFATSEQLFE